MWKVRKNTWVSLAVASLFLGVRLYAAMLYVDSMNLSPAPPYATWSSAATNIQDAIDMAVTGDRVLVTNGVYSTGGRVTAATMSISRVVITNPVTVESVNGPSFTIIVGYQVPQTIYGSNAVRCAYVGDGAALVGFTLTNGATANTAPRGGAAWCQSSAAVLSNCVLAGCAAFFTGGGVDGGTLYNCTLVSNSCANFGGGAIGAILNHCALIGNYAPEGGGALQSKLDDCTLTGNRATSGSSGDGGGGASQCALNGCTLTGNSTARTGGGAYGCQLTNCTLLDNSSLYTGGGASYCYALDHCILVGNSAEYGGGAHISWLVNCVITSNSASVFGGGVDGSASDIGQSTILNNCTLSNNSAAIGGAVSFATASNCMIISNVAGWGGGAYSGTLNNCSVSGNSATNGGGGTYSATLNNCAISWNTAGTGAGTYYGSLSNCTVVNNSATTLGGGSFSNTLNNCILYYNSAPAASNYSGGALNFCCTVPFATNGAGNITNEPLLVDATGNDIRLQPDSPCINSGLNVYARAGVDFCGNPRIAGGTVDIGACEYPAPSSIISYAWLSQYGFALDGSEDAADADGDEMNNWQEWIAGTDPTNASSRLRMLPVERTNNPVGILVAWESVSGRSYFLQRSTNLTGQPVFLTVATNIAGQTGATVIMDTNVSSRNAFFYRVGTHR